MVITYWCDSRPSHPDVVLKIGERPVPWFQPWFPERDNSSVMAAFSRPHSIAKSAIEWGTQCLCGPPAVVQLRL
jgi:hypothetical protein